MAGVFPNLPADLNIGRQIVNWRHDSAFSGFCDGGGKNVVTKIPYGKVSVVLHTHGLKISQFSYPDFPHFDIHNSQIISLEKVYKFVVERYFERSIIIATEKLVPKEKLVNKHFLSINFWNIETKSALTILVSSTEESIIDAFILRQKKEQNKNETENRIAKKGVSLSDIILMIIITSCTIYSFPFVVWVLISRSGSPPRNGFALIREFFY